MAEAMPHCHRWSIWIRHRWLVCSFLNPRGFLRQTWWKILRLVGFKTMIKRIWLRQRLSTKSAHIEVLTNLICQDLLPKQTGKRPNLWSSKVWQKQNLFSEVPVLAKHQKCSLRRWITPITSLFTPHFRWLTRKSKVNPTPKDWLILKTTLKRRTLIKKSF